MISTLGIAIGVMTLNIVLSVMTGFEEDLRDRILGFNPHVSIWSSASGPIGDYDEVVRSASRGARRGRAPSRSSTASSCCRRPQHFAGVLVRGIAADADGDPRSRSAH